MDELTQFNQERWNALVEAGIQYGQPLLDLTPESARTMVDDCGVMAPVGGKDVLCLASGGGQQSPAFALLGARVTVVDFAEKQLAQDALALAHYGLTGRLEQGDMRDLSRFADNSFDLVWHAFSLNFIPDPLPVFDEVRRVLRPGGQYRLQHHNPLAMDADEERWDGYGYPVRTPQIQGQEITFASETVRQGDRIHVTNAAGEDVDVKNVWYSGMPQMVRWRLKPQQTAQLPVLASGLESIDESGL